MHKPKAHAAYSGDRDKDCPADGPMRRDLFSPACFTDPSPPTYYDIR